MITISAFKDAPDFVKSFVRDLRVRWALEEAGLEYETRLLINGDQDQPDYRALQPFGQVPMLQDGDLTLFESGAIVLHIGEKSEVLLPKEKIARAKARQWVVAALNSVEPFIMNVALIDLSYANEEWAKMRRSGAIEVMHKKLATVATVLGNNDCLEGDRFTAGDLIMSSVLRILEMLTDIGELDSRLVSYIDRCTARPAYQRALAAHLADCNKAA